MEAEWRLESRRYKKSLKKPRRTKEQAEMKKTRIEIKNTQEGINRRITEAEWISDLEGRMVVISVVEENKEK